MSNDKAILIKKNIKIKAQKVQIDKTSIKTLPGISTKEKVKDNGL